MEYKTFTLKVPVPQWRWLRVPLQTLLLLIVVLSLALGWWSDHKKLSQEIDDLRNPRRGWDTVQVLGEPDTPKAGDKRTAWASLTQDGQDEWLVLDYAKAVVPTAVLVHENHKPGAVCKVTVFDSGGKESVAWEGIDPTPRSAASGVSRIDLSTAVKTKRIKVYLDSMAVPGWNEIDAVGLVYGKVWRQTQWAERAFSSSSYGKNNPMPETYTFGGLGFLR